MALSAAALLPCSGIARFASRGKTGSALRCSMPSPLLRTTTTPFRRSAEENRHRSRIVVASLDQEESESSSSLEAVKEFAKGVQENWERTDDKLAIAALGFSAVIALWASTGLVVALEKLPLVPDLLELVGILSSGWFVYRYLLFKPDREELLARIEELKKQVLGK